MLALVSATFSAAPPSPHSCFIPLATFVAGLLDVACRGFALEAAGSLTTLGLELVALERPRGGRFPESALVVRLGTRPGVWRFELELLVEDLDFEREDRETLDGLVPVRRSPGRDELDSDGIQ